MDALEYDLLSARHNPVSPTSTLHGSVSPGSDADGLYASHTFKIITTKRTLLLCAPTEEDEIKWLGAIRALIARRSGTGTVPGETPQAIASSRSGESTLTLGPQVSGGAGIKNKVQRPSVTAPVGSSSNAAEGARDADP